MIVSFVFIKRTARNKNSARKALSGNAKVRERRTKDVFIMGKTYFTIRFNINLLSSDNVNSSISSICMSTEDRCNLCNILVPSTTNGNPIITEVAVAESAIVSKESTLSNLINNEVEREEAVGNLFFTLPELGKPLAPFVQSDYCGPIVVLLLLLDKLVKLS